MAVQAAADLVHCGTEQQQAEESGQTWEVGARAAKATLSQSRVQLQGTQLSWQL